MITVLAHHPRAHDFLGYIPTFIDEADPRPAKQQLNEAYGFAGGWRPMDGWTFDRSTSSISYPGDPPLSPMASIMLRDEVIIVYRHAWVLVLQLDGSFEVARMD